jgi:hypothetical protein
VRRRVHSGPDVVSRAADFGRLKVESALDVADIAIGPKIDRERATTRDSQTVIRISIFRRTWNPNPIFGQQITPGENAHQVGKTTMSKLDGKVAVVTGSARGLGKVLWIGGQGRGH